MGDIKVFVLYHKPMPVFQSEVFVPLQTGCDDNEHIDGFLHDNTGDNISKKNKFYAELTGCYWVWKNYLPNHPELEYIGFCHYRRNWDLRKKGAIQDPWFMRKKSYSGFRKYFDEHSSSAFVREKLEDCDILLPGKISFAPYGQSNFESYRCAGHSDAALKAAREAVKNLYPECEEDFDDFFSKNNGYFCLNYIMRRELFEDFMTWLFSVLGEVERNFDWNCGDTYATSKMPAYIAERLLNVWLRSRDKKQGLKIIEKVSFVLVEPAKGFRYRCFVDSLVNFYHITRFHYMARFFKSFRKENKS